MLLKRITLGCILLCTTFVQAKVSLPAYYGDHMVLQQQATTTINGKANPNKEITLRTSWDDKTYSTRSDSKGKFSISVSTSEAGGPYSMQFSDGEILELKDILLGELWFCSGQSNMEMPVRGYKGQPVFGSQPYIVKAKEERPIRMFTVKNEWSKDLKDDISGTWMLHSPRNVGDFSAVAYFFGDMIEEQLGVPVGLINCSWSASKIESWIPKATLENISEIDLSILDASDFGYPNGTATLLYNAMLHPFNGLAVKGILWYQGEANSNEPELYKKLFSAFANDLRVFFNNPILPIYYVQIAPWQSGNKDELDWAWFRQAQLDLMKQVPNTGMVITADLGSEKFIHPPHKIEVGQRLAYWALANTYGKDGFLQSGPIFKDYEVKNSVVELYFDFGYDGLNPEKEQVEGFEIAGADNVFVPAQAEIIESSNIVRVWSNDIKDPKEVRYAFRNYKTGTLKNNGGLPAAPFRVEILK